VKGEEVCVYDHVVRARKKETTLKNKLHVGGQNKKTHKEIKWDGNN
jgi:hypothetical protein